MIDALRNAAARTLKVGVLRTLKGVHLAFTGILSKRAQRGDPRRATRRRDRPRRAVGEDDASSSAAGRTRCRPRAARRA